MTPDEKLLGDIRTKYGAFIDAAVAGTPFPASLVAALVANESGLNEQASRLEPNVLAQMTQVIVGRKSAFGSIGAQDLVGWCDPLARPETSDASATPRRSFGPALLALVNLATSWGPTQIMGYHALARHYDLSELMMLKTHFVHAVEILADFQHRFQLEPRPDAYLRCWNSGRPDGKTFDPNYAANGVARAQIYEALA